MRRYGLTGAGRPVVMLHGLESHSGWFVQSARRVAARGLPVHAFDRCGSGLSRIDSTLGARLDDCLAEIDAVADAALAGERTATFLTNEATCRERSERTGGSADHDEATRPRTIS